MAALNQGKIIKTLETVIKGSDEDFIWNFLKAYGTPQAAIKRLRLGDTQRNVARIAGDLAVNQKIYFRAVQVGSSLHEAMREIKEQPVLDANRIRFILVTDFQTVLAYDRKVDDGTDFDFTDFPANYEFFLPLTGQYEKAVAYAEHPADVKACEKMGRLYDGIRTINHYEKDDLHTLNVFLTRLLFCFFAENTGIFPIEHQMTTALQSNTPADGSDVADFFSRLFAVLDLPMDSEARRQYPASFQMFPYVNGDLFREKSRIPDFDAETRRLLIDCASMQWSDISPVIFGSMFQAVMNPEARRSLGAHYTSEKNILKLVRPLFLDGLEEEFRQILALNKGKLNALKEFQKKLGSLGFLDPACGCGNFLIVSYRELRELELRVLLAMREAAPHENLWMNVSMACKVGIDQFYGIELEEFPVEVARVSMLLMEHVMNRKTGEAFGAVFPSIPLQHSASIVCANALTTPWEEVVPPEKLHYILGNPPFVGASTMSREQKAQLMDVFAGRTGAGKLDFVTAWYEKASLHMSANTDIEAAFVSTNSICQGEQVAPLWKPLLDRGIVINFAHQTFQWSNEAKDKAAVYCVIIGFACHTRQPRKLFVYPSIRAQPNELFCDNINPYLIGSENIIVKAVDNALSAPNPMLRGNQPTDGGNLIIEAADYEDFIRAEPHAAPYIKKLTGSEEFLHKKERYCLWLVHAPEEILQLPLVAKRIEGCKRMRLDSRDPGCRRLAVRPSQFRDIHNPDTALVIPRVSSERRQYIPMDMIGSDTIVTDLVHIVPNATRYDFGILTSAMHMAWMRTVCGRLKSDYRYSRDLCYNTFPWPTVTEAQKKEVKALAEEVLMAREMYPELTLAHMYDPEKMPTELRAAHTALDLAVDALYRKKGFENDEERLQMLFDLYEKLVGKTAR